MVGIIGVAGVVRLSVSLGVTMGVERLIRDMTRLFEGLTGDGGDGGWRKTWVGTYAAEFFM